MQLGAVSRVKKQAALCFYLISSPSLAKLVTLPKKAKKLVSFVEGRNAAIIVF